MTDAGRHAADLLGRRLQRAEHLAGGDLSTVQRLVFDDGLHAVVKAGGAAPVEAAMLQALRAAGAPTPEVLACDRQVLVLSWVEADGPVAPAWHDLGCVLARLHAHSGPGYGWPQDYAFGLLPIDNRTHAHWPTFWAQRRLLPFVPSLPSALARRIERLAGTLDARLPATPPASLLHGDLWHGNVLCAGHRVAALIDPACYYGDAEVDLAMLQLFDRPDADFHAGYGPRRPGHAERLPIYRLWPALVHLTLFGEGYRALVERQLRDAGV